MKKIVLFSLVVCLGVISSSFASDSAAFSSIAPKYNINRNNNAWFNLGGTNAKLNCDDNGHYNGPAYNGTVAIVTNQEQVINGPVQCYTRNGDDDNVNDEWKGIGNVGWCGNNTCPSGEYISFGNDASSPLRLCNIKRADYKIFSVQGAPNNKLFIYDFIDREHYAFLGSNGASEILCKFCKDGYKQEGGKCVDCPDCNKKVNPKPDPVTVAPKPDTKPKKTCKELYAGYPERIKCCEAGKATKWTGSVSSGTCSCVDKSKEWKDGKCIKKSDATCEEMYKGNEVAIACCNNSDSSWNSDLKKCECNEENKEWKYDEKTKAGKCIDNGSVVEPTPTTCTETDCKITINQTIRCFNNGNYFNSTENYSVCKEDLDALRLDCNGLKTRVNACQNTDCIRGLLTRIDAFDALIAKVCKPSGAPTPVVVPDNSAKIAAVYVPDNSAKIAAAKQIVSSFFGSAESNKSVWKDSEGNFNTARLASDLTAGVVLGTVGGVVSGVVIKKKQVEKGFDALHCAVGGQTVADWGDTFNVGLRR